MADATSISVKAEFQTQANSYSVPVATFPCASRLFYRLKMWIPACFRAGTMQE